MRRLSSIQPFVAAAALAAEGAYAGAVFVLLVAAMLYHMPLLDWLYTQDEEHRHDRSEP